MESVSGPERSRPSGSRRARWKFALLVLLVLGALAAVRWTPLAQYASRDGALALLDTLRTTPGSAFVFTAIYAIASGFALPGTVLTLTGGAVWGVWPGLLLNLTGATAGSTIAFLIARFLGRDFVKDRLGQGRIAELDRKAAENGFMTIFLLRLVPLVPFNALNYGAGLSAVRLRDYVPATAVGIIPGAFAYTYFADSILAGSLEAQREALYHTLAAAGLLVLLALLPLIWKKVKGGEVVEGASVSSNRDEP